ncbi:RDD family protein [Halobacillus alkaliphilus]|uniref:RDD family protein n=1 Tax=Halobacillus alkaliphilus TaxID=396056 RepID=A0A1I2JT61_9BACI|nr:RDD family protein [Halobacillus alkaliphilus]SFF57193.1 RDD family protein [Halobacillus alkaliphilus]
MESVTKKRSAAFAIDLAISTAVTFGVEKLLRKKVKSEAFHALITPTLVMWSLEYAQLKTCGSTVGYQALGLKLEKQEGGRPMSGQIVKRMAYRDFISSLDYLKDRKGFQLEEGALMPHDRYSETIVKEVECSCKRCK